MGDSIAYKLHSGKPSKMFFFVKGYLLRLFLPKAMFRRKLESVIAQVESREDCDYIMDRVNYYNRMSQSESLPKETLHENNGHYYVFLDKIRNFNPSTFHKVYYFDLHEIMRWFNRDLRIGYIPGDVYFDSKFPAIVKSRLLGNASSNSVVLKLDKLRHFMFVKDDIPFVNKKNMVIFRGKIRQSRMRYKFMEMYFSSNICDCGIVGKNEGFPEKWMVSKKTIREHLEYKFIMALEGNDVASNLKWVMSSNSIAVMTHPTCETWFMEGRLIPDYHYICINDDLSNLEEKVTYYINHPDKAEEIIAHAHEYVAQFFDEERERLISLMVADKYFRMTGQK